ncbi:hypothetical protein PUN28_005310 [Cardiocondyla obscurior]|uniref:Protein CUSTOS n=1 Tax=Cardiocondyla obscurior TaxID=286306 RepID=A0AAW2GL51_9HYME
MKNINKQADLSSSEDETSANILKEAIDQQFLNDDLYNVEKVDVNRRHKVQNNNLDKTSLRIISKQDKFTNFGVTPTFQSFIAKKLDEILERENIDYCGQQKRKKNKSFGIKLLSTSKKSLTVKIKEDCTKNKRFKGDMQTAEFDDDDLSKFQEVAVDPEHILSKLDTKVWANKRPESEFKYKKLKNGSLVEI